MSRYQVVAAVLTLAVGNSAQGSTYDSCILQFVQSTSSEAAVIAIKESCIRTVEAPLPSLAVQSLLSGSHTRYGKMPSPETGGAIYVTLNNNSDYTVTELVMEVVDKKTKVTEHYVLRLFPPPFPPGAVFSSFHTDLTRMEMLGPGRHEFYFAVSQTARDTNKWTDAYACNFVSAKGFRD